MVSEPVPGRWWGANPPRTPRVPTGDNQGWRYNAWFTLANPTLVGETRFKTMRGEPKGGQFLQAVVWAVTVVSEPVPGRWWGNTEDTESLRGN
ncbi:hypothetical protein HAX54_040132 [Datura stramonium]|uniref:Uncharacterized protein n=1 Tax=Datura stramonium TaxID=4076 RepID=A0ABS8VM81_DATST|nr:hypothetical protein [Datura stramonium]